MSAGAGSVRAPDLGGWREVDPESGEPAFVCPRCWPAVEARWRARADVAVRELGGRPPWARCGVCEPECAC